MDNRLKGQDVEIQVVKNGEIVSVITAVKSLELSSLSEVTEEMYVGEIAPRFDSFDKGFRGKIEVVNSDVASFNALSGLDTRSRTRLPGSRVNVKSTFSYPDGSRFILLLLDCSFEEVPLSFGGRSEYGSTTLSFKCTRSRALTR